MYCNQLMSYGEVWSLLDVGPHGYAGEEHYIYLCEHCRSQQDVDIPTGQIVYYNFRVGLYHLVFHPKYGYFTLGEGPPEEIGNTDTILEFDFLPKGYTPQNTTIERIKLLLLFS
jgi:hypothetical protein